MIIKKPLKEILLKIVFRRQEKGLSMFYLINRKEISKIGVYVAKKKVRGSVERNIIKRRTRIAYKILIKKIYFLQFKVLFFFLWEKKQNPSLKKLVFLLKKIFMTNLHY